MTSNTPSSPHPLGWLPNFLTLSRIATIPLIMWGIIAINTQAPHVLGRPTVILILFLLAGLTDFLDGYFARRWNVTSDFGRMIDPIADKLLVAGCLIALAIVVKAHPLFMIPAIAIIFRDILVSGVREHAALIGRVMPPTNLAKWKTACEMLAIFIFIVWVSTKAWMPLSVNIPPSVDISAKAGLLFLWLAAALSVYTGTLYFRAALRD